MNLSNMPPEVRAFRRDLAKCEGVGCDIRQLCRRFTRPAVDGQQWIEPRWTDYLVNAAIGIRKASRCLDHQPPPASQVYIPGKIEPHGGAPEEEDAC